MLKQASWPGRRTSMLCRKLYSKGRILNNGNDEVGMKRGWKQCCEVLFRESELKSHNRMER